MAENVCNLFNEFFSGTSAKVKDFRPALVANCVFNSFLCYTNIIFEHRYHPCDKENCVVAKTFENIITEPGCLRCWRWFVGPTALHFYFGQPVKSKTYRLHFLQEIFGRYQFLLYILALECCNHKCGQVLSCSSSSQISRACDSQARHCSGDINMAVKRNYFF